jgi:hypothetical protein
LDTCAYRTFAELLDRLGSDGDDIDASPDNTARLEPHKSNAR